MPGRERVETNVLDHIIHLSPPGELQTGIERFERLGFKVLPGGTHADGLTSNALVVLSDGVYVELIAFTHDVAHYMQALTSSQLSPVEKNAAAELLEKREKHWWGSKSPGWIDWANLGLGGEDMGDILNASSSIEGGGSNGAAVVKYLAPLEGGRTKPDGDLLRWRVIFPDSAVHGRGAVPFFCEDLTPRDRRVPLAPSGSDHPCKATGIAYISLCAPTASEFNKLSSQLSFVLGDSSNPRISPDGKEARWTLKTPQDTAPATHDEAVVVTKAQRLELVLRTATEPDRPISIEEGGEAWIDEVGFWVDGDSGGDFGHGEVASGGRETGFGKVAFVPLPQTKV